MQHKSTRRLFILNALRLGALLAVPLPAHAAGNGDILIQDDIVDTGSANDSDAGALDNVVVGEADEEDENTAAGSASQPEYKYVSIRRF